MVVQTTATMTFGTFNAKGAFGGMPEHRLKHDLTTIQLRAEAQYGRGLDVLGLQEFWPHNYITAINTALGHQLQGRPENSVANWVNADLFETIETRQHAGHDAVIIDGKVVSDKRPIESVIIRDRQTGLRFAVVSGHPVPGGFLYKMVDGKRVWIYKSGWRKRRAAWRLWRRNLIAVIKELSARGLPVFVALDANKAFPAALLGGVINGQDVKYVRNGIDWMIFVDSFKHQWKIDRTSKWIVKALFSDHDAILITAKLTKK